jgi:hypothetical protein
VACDTFVTDARQPTHCHLCGHPKWQHRAGAFLSDEKLLAEFTETAKKFDATREGDGHGGSPGEWAYERCGELEIEIKRRGLAVPNI